MSPSFSQIASTIQSPIDPQGEFHYYTKIQQSDLVPTISSLLSWTIPRNNIGVLLRSFLGLWKGMYLLSLNSREDQRDQVAVIGSSIVQISKLVKLSRPDIFASEYTTACSEDDEIGCLWSRCKQSWNSQNENSIDTSFEVDSFDLT
jgi:ethanolamine phosphate transferase 2 subunit G